MKIKTSELTGAALDWAVAKAEGKDFFIEGKAVLSFCPGADIPGVPYFDREYWMPSVKWSQGGPILERERIELQWHITPEHRSGEWFAVTEYLSADDALYRYGADSGPTPLIAAMRCYVASKLGDEVEIPGVLL